MILIAQSCGWKSLFWIAAVAGLIAFPPCAEAGPTAEFTITITFPDLVPPDPPVISDIVSNSSGRIKSISGTAEANSTVHLFIDGVDHPFSAGAGPWTLSEIQAPGAHSIYAYAVDDWANQSLRSRTYLDLGCTADVFQDATTSHSGGTSAQLAKDTSLDFKIAANDGVTPEPDEPVTVKAWMRKSTAYSGTSPKITLTGLGIAGTGQATASMTAGPDTWEQLTVTGTPDGGGVLTLRVETFSTAAESKAWIDDITTVQ